jgi:hypothetical protein
MDHPTDSPGIAPCDFRLFPKLKSALKDRFADFLTSEQRENVTVKYSGKRFPIPFLAVAPSPHEVHSFTRRAFRK